MIEEEGLSQPELDVYAVAERLGLRVRQEEMDDDMSGYLEQQNGGWVIGINKYHHPRRQRFTVAHEIAHYLLHRGRIGTHHQDETFARRSELRNPMEREADEFAAGLLMPAEMVQQFIGMGVKGLNELAAAFGVSVLAMRYRLHSLNYDLA